MSYMARRVQGFGNSVFFEMTALADRHHAVNLGQGFPDFPCPDFLKQAAAEAIRRDINQYAPSNGRLALRESIAKALLEQYGIHADPGTEITVTHGATEAIFAAVQGLVDPGDEVILFEPFYDSYLPCVEMAGGIPRYYTLRPPHWALDPEQLASLFTTKTKLLILNTPHNPTGKVFSEQELNLIAGLCRQHDVLALADEVYEHIVFDGLRHRPLASLPGMRERTVMISSLGKTFSVTGWKVGWAVAEPELTQALFRSHQFVVFAGSSPLQEAAATALSIARDYYIELAELYQTRRDFLVAALRAAGLKPLVPRGTYFMMVDISDLGFEDDVSFCRYLATEIGVAAIPPSAFYHDPRDGSSLARFAFCKSQRTLEAAAERLLKLARG
jgi:aspartate/methionine/tyrosine aminotransferase